MSRAARFWSVEHRQILRPGSRLQTMVEHGLLKKKLQDQLDELDLAEEEKDRLVRELSELACILIDACRARDAGAKS